MNLVLSSLNAQTSLTTRIAQYDIKVDDSVTYRTGQNVIRPYNIGNRYKDLSAIVKGLVDTVRAGGGGGATDTTSLSNRINERIKYSDTTNRIATIKTLADTMRRDSIQTVLARGNNSNKGIRFGSSANTFSTTIDSSGIQTGVSSTNYSLLNSSGVISFSSTTRFDYGYDGIYRYNSGTGYYNRIVIPNPVGSTKTITFQDKTGTLALLSDITDTLRRDSLQVTLARGRNTTIPIRFGSSANVGSMTIDSNSIVHYTNGNRDFSLNSNALWLYNGGGSFYNSVTTATPSANRATSFQDKSGTVALLSDFTDTIANRVAVKSDTVWGTNSLRLATESDLNARMATITDTIANRVLVKSDTTSLVATKANLNTKVTIGGNTVGNTMVYGVIDSFNRVEQNFNTYDTVYANGRHTYNGKWAEVVASFYNNNSTTGVRQTNSINLICGTGTVSSLNTPAISFGVPNSATSPRLSLDGLIGYSVLNMYSSSTSGSIIKPAFTGSNTGDALTVSLGSYTVSNNTPNAGNLNVFRIGTGYLSTGRFAPTSGTANLRGVQGAIYINATSTWSGTVKMYTDDSVTLAGLASGTYIAYESNQNSGWGFRQNGASAKNSFVGRTTFGTTTDNGSDAVQVVGDVNLTTAGNKLKIATGSNASVNGSTFSGGAVTVSNTSVTASSRIFIQYTSCSNCGTTYITAKVAGTSFTVTSSNVLDASTFDYWIIN